MVIEEEPIFGEVYQVGDTWIYHCEYCAADFFYPWQMVVVLRANAHEVTCHVKPYRYK